ncbi:NUDIX hydrolase [Oscillochloris trichoides DG-6]|uniref:NUDIX hydrolase n=1 Tax=Oscillochloris trichoides DG-6 TaxID=765420 RepID=E1IEF0_9CHLR|nr:NUDIX domain-containing protein [Oscillochloris trichoides]EFO80476.1 NUDIX hydrolase [Oscillochloris trichoides DG-6]
MYRQHSHCSFCGSSFNDGQRWPRVCPNCSSTTYRNPLPVVIVLQPVDDGLLLIRRGAAPRQGQLALPGGFIEMQETWQQAAARELYEEAGVRISPEEVETFSVRSTHDGYLLVFALGPLLREVDLPAFIPNKEAGARVLINTPTELAFPLHTEAVTRFFTQRGQWRTLT